jgi:hypothetical protein
MQILEVIIRVYLRQDMLGPAIAFYESLFSETCRLRFSNPAVHLELAQVSYVLLIAGSADDLEPFRETHSTFLVDDLDAFSDASGTERCADTLPA